MRLDDLQVGVGQVFSLPDFCRELPAGGRKGH